MKAHITPAKGKKEIFVTTYASSSSTVKPSKSPRKSRGVAGSDGFIIAEALHRYIATEAAKPDREQSWSNLQNARALFNACVGAKNAGFFADGSPGVTISLVDEKGPRDLE